MDTTQWKADLDYLAGQIRAQHANPYHQIGREALDAAFADVRERLPQLQRHQILVEMARLLTLVGDGHSSFWLEWNNSLKFHKYPLRFYEFSDGIFVYEAAEEQRAYLGMRLVAVGVQPVEEALRRVASVVPRDNEMGVKLGAPHVLSIPEVLHTFGLSDTLDSADFTLEDAAGKQQTVCLPPLQPDAHPNWVRLYENETPLALWQRDPERDYWYEYLERERTVYVQHRSVRDMPDERIEAFCGRLFDFIDAHSVERLVLDIRSNGGGNNMLNQPLLHGLICCKKINQPGRLFTIIGRRTFSAAMNLAVDIERNTKSLFAGECTGSRPNAYGENTGVTLPNSGVTCSISSLYWQSSLPNDKRMWIEPHIPADMSSTDYRNNVDPVLNAVLSYRT